MRTDIGRGLGIIMGPLPITVEKAQGRRALYARYPPVARRSCGARAQASAVWEINGDQLIPRTRL